MGGITLRQLIKMVRCHRGTVCWATSSSAAHSSCSALRPLKIAHAASCTAQLCMQSHKGKHTEISTCLSACASVLLWRRSGGQLHHHISLRRYFLLSLVVI